eukprot:m.106334 g.106334  ORF g.106334 m.106334 type:complete len:227 (-) comp15815_c3_seq1:1131-1811(-)
MASRLSSLNLVTSEAEKLAQSLLNGHKMAAELLSKASALKSKLEVLKECDAQFAALNEAGQRKPLPVLLGNSESLGISSEWVMDLQEENNELRAVLDEVQSTLDLIMHKHRNQVEAFIQVQKAATEEARRAIERDNERSLELETEIVRLKEKIDEMTTVMCAAVEWDNNRTEATARLVQLEAENEALRELLGIAGIPTSEEFKDEEVENNNANNGNGNGNGNGNNS